MLNFPETTETQSFAWESAPGRGIASVVSAADSRPRRGVLAALRGDKNKTHASASAMKIDYTQRRNGIDSAALSNIFMIH